MDKWNERNLLWIGEAMPIIIKEPMLSNLEVKIKMAANLVTPDLFLEFSNQLTPEQDKLIPRYSTVPLLEVVHLILRTLVKSHIEVATYRSRWPWSKARAYTMGKNININTRHEHSVKNLIKTYVHELSHIASKQSNESFDHGSNSNQHKKLDTAPILIANMYLEFLRSKRLL